MYVKDNQPRRFEQQLRLRFMLPRTLSARFGNMQWMPFQLLDLPTLIGQDYPRVPDLHPLLLRRRKQAMHPMLSF
jgi:hypothetical protein